MAQTAFYYFCEKRLGEQDPVNSPGPLNSISSFLLECLLWMGPGGLSEAGTGSPLSLSMGFVPWDLSHGEYNGPFLHQFDERKGMRCIIMVIVIL